MSAGLSPTDPLLGRVLAERYQILHRLGEGAMGVVYKARHVRVGRLLAVKVLHARSLLDSKVAQRFAREAELAGRLRHPNVIGVVDVGEVDGTRYMVMDYVEGPDLARLLDEAPMRGERIIRLVRQMLDGLHHAHEQGMIHRDFKPENVIVERDRHGGETPRIVDFGIALLREGSDSPDGQGRLTTNGLVLGTPHYMAPEQAVADPIDHRIDLFALGIVVYEMLSGRLPFDGSGAEVARANLLLDPPPINKRVPHLEVDPLLEAFARRLMAKKRNARPATAKAARELLDLIDRDRSAAAPLLGVPLARSGRTPAVTESVDADEVSGATQSPETTRMKPTPTPRAADPVAPARAAAAPSEPHGPGEVPWGGIGTTAPPVGFPVGGAAGWSPPAGEPSWGPPGSAANEPSWAPQGDAAASAALGGGGPVPPIAPGMAYFDHVARPPGGGYGAPRKPPHRDTALRTPLGWQTSSLPGRRRSWLIGGAVVGTACVLAAAVVITVWTDRADPVASESMAIFSPDPRPPAAPPAPVAAAAAPAVTGAPSNDVGAVATPAAPAAVGAAAAAQAPGDAGAAAAVAPSAADHRKPAAAPSRSRSKPADRSAAGARALAAGSTEPAPRGIRQSDAAPPGEPASREPAAEPAPARPARAEPPRVEHAPAAPPATPVAPPPASGISAAELGRLFDEVKSEIEQVPEDNRRGLLDQLAMLNIMRAMRESQQARDDAAAQLSKLRQRVRDRRAGR